MLLSSEASIIIYYDNRALRDGQDVLQESGLSQMFWATTTRDVLGNHNRKCFHISCAETMVDLVSSHSSRFGLHTGAWGLMLRAWLEDKGINLANIARL